MPEYRIWSDHDPDTERYCTNPGVIFLRLVRQGRHIRVQVVHADGTEYPAGNLVQFESTGTLHLFTGVNRDLNFEYTTNCRIVTRS